MAGQRRDGTAPEMLLRRALFARGLRYRLGLKVPGKNRRTIDIAFATHRLAIFVDGCFWHRCPVHSVPVKNNADWWALKLQANVERDRDTDRLLGEQGWVVLRYWEHDDMEVAARNVEAILVAMRRSSGSLPQARGDCPGHR